MERFSINEVNHKKIDDLLEVYSLYVSGNLPNALKQSVNDMFSGINDKVKEAYEKKVNIDEFSGILNNVTELFLTEKEIVEEALKYIEAAIPKDVPVSVCTFNGFACIQKRVGIKSTEVEEALNVSKEEADKLMRNGFISTYVDVIYRKKILKILSEEKKRLGGVSFYVSDVYAMTFRKFYDIDVNFCIPLHNLDEDIIKEILYVAERLGEITFTV